MAQRTKYAGDISIEDVDKTVTLKGWVQRRRDLGAIIFVQLRDRAGIVQIVFRENISSNLHDLAASLRSEYVIEVTGKVCKRSEGEANDRMKTGAVEIEAESLKILNTSNNLPFNIEDNVDVKEDLKLKYRYLDLRRPEMQQAIMLRSKLKHSIHHFMDEHGFIDIETPNLTKSTPEGARDFLVPSRTYPGNFWALPQSPQLFKQLLMTSGFDRYYQIARCFRDEDLRGDRQPEFTQLDIETSFLSEEEIIELAEQLIAYVLKETVNVEVKLPIERMDWNFAMDHYGSDKPDLRFDMQLINVEEVVRKTNFKVFSSAIDNGGIVRALVVPQGAEQFSRKDIDSLGEYVKRFGAKGLAWLKVKDGEVAGPIAKFMNSVTEEILSTTEAKDGDLILFAADEKQVVYATLGYLRNYLADQLGLIDHDEFRFVWITNWPMFHYSKEEERYVAEHHPFTLPQEETVKYLESDPSKVYAHAYDICLNGYELGGGSLRIYTREIQEKMFKALGFSVEDANERFGFLMNALDYGFPPLGGIAFGLDRFAMLLAKKDNIRDVIAFPKNSKGVETLTEAPGGVESAQLDELGISTLKKLPASDLKKIEKFDLDDEISVRRVQLNDAKQLNDVIDKNRDYLAIYLPWARNNDLLAEEKFVSEAVASFEIGSTLSYVIEKDDKIIGSIDLHDIKNSNAEIGYWIVKDSQKQGIISRTVKALIDLVAPVLKLHRIIIRTDPSNTASKNVAKNAGFIYEGLQYESQFVDGKYLNLEVYYYLTN